MRLTVATARAWARDGVTAYAFVRGQVPAPAKNGLIAVWRTTDGGAHWRPVDPRAHPNTALGVALLPDGRLLITTETFEGSNAWYSDDGARTFRRAAGPGPLLAWIEEAGGRYTAGGVFGGYYTSTDGRSWTPVRAVP